MVQLQGGKAVRPAEPAGEVIKIYKEYKTLRTCVAAYRNKRKSLFRQGVHKADRRYAQYTSSVPRKSGRVPEARHNTFFVSGLKIYKEYKTLRTCVAAYRNKRKSLFRQGVHKADRRYAQYTSSVPRRSGRVPYHERDSDQRIGQMLRPDAEAFAPEFHFPLYQLHFFAPHPVHSTQRFHLLSIKSMP